MMLTRGFAPASRGVGAARPFLGPNSRHSQVSERSARLPLVLVDRARQEALELGALRRDAAADHLGDRARHDDGGAASGRAPRAARFIAPSVPVLAEFSSPRPVTTIGSSCGGSPSV